LRASESLAKHQVECGQGPEGPGTGAADITYIETTVAARRFTGAKRLIT
jgi:hypothetical protein